MIRVHLSKRFERLGWDVFVIRHPRAGITELGSIATDGSLQFDRPFEDGVAKLSESPTFFLHDDVLKALVDAATEKLPADGSMAAHLKDTQTTRDRLLSMLEQRGIR